MKRLLSKVSLSTVMLLLVLAIPLGIALAATITMTQTWTHTPANATPYVSSSTVKGTVAPSWGWPNVPIPGGTQGSGAGNAGQYRIMTNYWNFDTAISGVQSPLTFGMDFESDTGEFWVTASTSSYYPGNPGRGGPCATRDAGNPQSTGDPSCNWTPNNIHAPASYPSIYKGCHYNQCSAGMGAPFPMKVSEIASLPSKWVVDVDAAPSTAVYDVAYDIWLDQNLAGNLPGSPGAVGQNDGAEIMIWMNNRGYDEVNNRENPIRPAGTLVADGITLTGVSGTWDVWVEPTADPAGAIHWRIISYVRQDRVEDMTFDSKPFIDYAITLDCDGINCVHPSWWLTSVQAGFEIWADGDGLRSTEFSVEPVTVSGEVTGIARTDDGRPIVHWAEPFTLKTAGCAGGTGTYDIDPTDGPNVSGALTETPANSGAYQATIGPVQPSHGDSTIAINIACPDGSSITQNVPVFIDPSGFIMTPEGYPVEGATVTLFHKVGANWVKVTDPAVMLPPVNSQITLADGRFGWDVLPDTYKVRAEKTGCHAPGDETKLFVETGELPVPPEYTNLYLYLDCGGGTNPGDGLTVTVLPMSDWETGYCRTVVVTNNTTAAVDWKVTFQTPGKINNFWNVVWSQSGNTVTAEGVSWNNTLQPGESTHSLGFCANR